MSADVYVQNEGSIFLFLLISEAARDWWNEHVQEGMTFRNKSVVEWRYAPAIIDGMVDAGFELGGI